MLLLRSWVVGGAVVVALQGLAGCTASHDMPGMGLLELAPDASTDDGDDEAGRGGSTAAGTEGSTATAGRGGSAGGGGIGGRAGVGGRAASNAGSSAAGSGTIPCGMCPAPGGLSSFVQATSCCTENNECGLTAAALGVSTCAPLNAPGTADGNCPSVSIAQGFTLGGCCTPDGTCGALDTFLGLGCVAVPTGTNGQTVSCAPR